MKIYISNRCSIALNEIQAVSEKRLLDDLKKCCTYRNPAYYANKKRGYPTYKTPENILLYAVEGEKFTFARGFLDKITRILNRHKAKFEIIEQFPPEKKIKIKSSIVLRDTDQKPIFDMMTANDMGVYCAPCGAGKTVTGLGIISAFSVRTLILVHTKKLLEQWVGEIENFFKIKKSKIGILGAGFKRVKDITVGLMQTVKKRVPDLQDSFDLLLVDECHHCPCDTLFNIVDNLPCRYKFGATATPKRKDKKDFLLKATLGNILIEHQGDPTARMVADLYVVPTKFTFPYYDQQGATKPIFNCMRFVADTDEKLPQCPYGKAGMDCVFRGTSEDGQSFQYKCRYKMVYEKNHTYLVNRMSEDQQRNALILRYVMFLVQAKVKTLILFDRIESIVKFKTVLEGMGVKAGALVSDSHKGLVTENAVELFAKGKISVLMGTSVADEGLDLPMLECVIMAHPCATNPGLMKQRIGRAERIYPGKKNCLAIYFLDWGVFSYHIKTLKKQYQALRLINDVSSIVIEKT